MEARNNNSSSVRAKKIAQRTTVLVLLVALAVVAWIFLPRMFSNDGPGLADSQSRPQTVFVDLLTLEEQQVSIPIRYSGEIRAKRKTDIGFPRGGKIEKIFFDEGEFVKPTQKIAELDNRQPTARLKQLKAEMMMVTAMRDEMLQGPRTEMIQAARANVEDLEHQLENAVLDFERSVRLLEKRGISQQEHDQATYLVRTIQAKISAAQAQFEQLNTGTRAEQVDASEARLNAAIAAVELAQSDLEDCTLRAPYSGTIERRMLDEGAVVSAGTPVLSLIESDQLEFHVGIPVKLASSISDGEAMSILVGGTETKATLKSKLKSLDLATRTLKVVLSLDPSATDLGIVDGQMGQIEFQQASETRGFKIPVTAIVNDQQGLWSCYTVSKIDGKQIAKRQAIEVLYFQGDWVFVRGTISEGQTIVTSGLQRLSNGQVVKSTRSESKDEGD